MSYQTFVCQSASAPPRLSPIRKPFGCAVIAPQRKALLLKCLLTILYSSSESHAFHAERVSPALAAHTPNAFVLVFDHLFSFPNRPLHLLTRVLRRAERVSPALAAHTLDALQESRPESIMATKLRKEAFAAVAASHK
jgi:hypothetical protein